ncbi:probable outer membrane protein [Laribacter hongkongensis HLHK9]|uniref:Outer membrane protein assembly factor BamA n=1 Tax=Laribacter hongkongensis (strain HLHK9) TaxID=557598 RepID=C1DAF2_LARHH|nr:outer membrane protein assembly factor BamA [Laribacter hongkongensis]ACO75267.1 probable outer membrane protein [Laribacter hongkongensis HLHK9]
MKLTNLAAAIIGLAALPSLAATPFVVRDIRVEGLQRTEPGTVFNYLPLKVGDTFTDTRAQDAIKALFATGFFDDVRIESESDVVIVSVDERPVVAQLSITGAKEFDKDQLKKALKENGFAESRIFDQALLDQAVQELKRQYFTKGKYSVEIKPTVTKLDRNRVAVALDISEGPAARIKRIDFVGNQAFSADDLSEQMQLATPGWFSWFTKDDQYSRQKLTGDLEKLRAFYLNQGYFEFNIDSTQVSISPDKEDMFITVNVSEGKKYTVSDVRLAGDMIVPEAELLPLLVVKKGDTFTRDKITDSVTAITDRLGAEGYAFANINAVPEVDKEKGEVGFTFFVDPGRRTYVRKINIVGNTRTRDEVIRREMRQMEAGWYDAAKIKRSKERLDLLGYFTDVNVETPAVPDTADQVDVNFKVTEKPTGNVTLGAGYAQDEGLILSAGISQSNFFGSGKAVSASFNTSKLNRYLNLSFTDPYFTNDGVSIGYDLYTRRYSPNKTDTYQYQTDTTGAAVRFGFPITEYDTINTSLGVEQVKVKTFAGSPQRYKDYVNQFGDNNLNYLAKVGWGRDTRDSFLWPTKGRVSRINLEVALPGSDIQYGRIVASQQFFWPLSKTFTLALNGEIGAVQSYGSTSSVPFFQNFYLGGIGSVRGFETGSIGPRDELNDAYGATRRAIVNAEVLFPFPGMKDDKTLRMSGFVDAGTLWGGDYATAADGKPLSWQDNLRYSTGVALSWLSPLGPMKFSFAYPLKKEEGDQIQRFQFTLGTVF